MGQSRHALTPGINEALWRKTADIEWSNPANVKLVSEVIRESLTVIAFNPKHGEVS